MINANNLVHWWVEISRLGTLKEKKKDSVVSYTCIPLPQRVRTITKQKSIKYKENAIHILIFISHIFC